jgi:hypothetical protein
MGYLPLHLVFCARKADRELVPSLTLGKPCLDPCFKALIPAFPIISSYYIVGIPIGIYLAFRQHMGLWGLWIGLAIALVCTSASGGLIVLRADWDHEVRKVADRLESDRNPSSGVESAESA